MGAKQYNFIDLTKTLADEVRHNWELLKDQNVRKANFICNGQNAMPSRKEDIAQNKLFVAQKEKYVDKDDSVAILNSFPIFLFEYLR